MTKNTELYLNLPGEKLSGRDLCLLMAVFTQAKYAGFSKPDARIFPCPECGCDGFNTGMGVVSFACGGEYCGDHMSEPCGADDD